MARSVEAAELPDVDVREFARFVALVAPHRLDRLQVFPAVQAVALEDPADGGRGDSGLGRDPGCGAALAAQRDDLLTDCLGRRLAQPARARGAVMQTLGAFRLVARDPFLAVFGQTPKAVATAFGVCPASGTRRTMVPRP